jgi:sugar lactone lactonase YvrE
MCTGGRVDVGETGISPCFMNVNGRTAVITDLSECVLPSTRVNCVETNTVLVCDALNGNVHSLFGHGGRSPGEFSFVSGVRLDDHGNMIIGDAKNKRVQVRLSTEQLLALCCY